MLTEFGGIAYAAPEEPDANKIWGYVRSSNVSELEIRYTALLSVVNKVELFSGFCYTQLTDTYQEANGLLYADRTPKFPLEAIAYATLGRGEEEEEDAMLSSSKAKWSPEENVLPGAVKPGWASNDSIQQIPHCGRHPAS
jgi:hypothetical protein